MNAKTKSEIERNRKFALYKTIELGREIQLKHPEIVDYWRDINIRKKDVVKKLDLTKNFPYEDIAITAVYRALHGYDGKFPFINFPAYEGLMSEKERLQILLDRRFRNGKKHLTALKKSLTYSS